MVSNFDVNHCTKDRIWLTHHAKSVLFFDALSVGSNESFRSGPNATVTYDVRLGYKTDEMFEDPNSEWILDVQSRESRSIQCQPIYHHGIENKVCLFAICGVFGTDRFRSSFRIHPMHIHANRWLSWNWPPWSIRTIWSTCRLSSVRVVQKTLVNSNHSILW